MLPLKLTGADSETERSRWKVVRLDLMADMPGQILAADCQTGECLLKDRNGECNGFSFGPNGLAIILRTALLCIGLALGLSACAGTAPPPQPSPASIGNAIQQLAAIAADPAAIWQAGDYATRAACDSYLNRNAVRDADIGFADNLVGTSGLAAAGMTASMGNPAAAALTAGATGIARNFLGDFRQAGALPYGPETTVIVQKALDAYEAATRPPASKAEAMADIEGLWWLCSPAGYAELVAKSIGSAQVSAAAMPVSAAALRASPSRPRVLVNGR